MKLALRYSYATSECAAQKALLALDRGVATCASKNECRYGSPRDTVACVLVFQITPLPRNLDSCERDIRHSDPRIRLSVVRDLSRSHPQEERLARVALLVASLEDKNGLVREHSLLALADLGASSAIDQITPLLSDLEIPIRQIALLCLGELGEADDEKLMKTVKGYLKSSEPSLRYQALLAISQLSPWQAREPIEQCLEDEDAKIRELALRLVDEVMDEQAVLLEPRLQEKVIAACVAPEDSVRTVAQLVAGQLGLQAPREMIVQLVAGRRRAQEPRDEQTALELCGRLKLNATKPRLQRRAFGWWGWSVDPFRWIALSSLVCLGDETAWNKLMKGLNSRSRSERASAALALGRSGHPRAHELLKALTEKEEVVPNEILREALENLEKAREGLS